MQLLLFKIGVWGRGVVIPLSPKLTTRIVLWASLGEIDLPETMSENYGARCP